MTNKVPVITIPKEEYRRLVEDRAKLYALEEAGVDNWDGYSYCLELLADNKAQEGKQE